LPLLIGTSNAMKHRHADFRDSPFDGDALAIRTKLGQALREQYNLAEPLPQSLVELLSKLDIGACVRDVTRERLYAEVDECVAAMVHAANRKPGEPGQT
jgi:hypothetical protein